MFHSLKIFTLLVHLIIINGIPLNLPERNSYGEVHMIASLRNEATGEVYHMEEYLSTKNSIKGRIKITKDSQTFDVFYNENDNFRLVIYDNDCHIYYYNNQKWNAMLPNVKNELENIVLMFGPSIYYRIQALLISESAFWVKGFSQEIRGRMMDSQSTAIESTLRMRVYKEANSNIQSPERVELVGFLSEISSTYPIPVERLIIDFYVIEQRNDDLEYFVAPTPGIGCFEYLENNLELPTISSDKVHFISSESSDPSSEPSLAEIYVDKRNKIIHYSARFSGILSAAIYDYKLGISYTLDLKDSCLHEPIVENDQAVLNNQFNEKELFWLNGQYKYLGKLIDESYSGVICSIWESVAFNSSVDRVNYAKIVTTQYFAENTNVTEKISYSDNYVLVGTTRKAYNIDDTTGKYYLEDYVRRNIYDFKPSISDSDYRELFQVSSCFPSNDQRQTLVFNLRPSDPHSVDQALDAAEEYLYSLRNSLRENIVSTINVSPLRIASIDFDFTKEEISAKVLFLEKPEFEAGFTQEIVRVKKSSLTSLVPEASLDDCIQRVTATSNYREVLFCEDKFQNYFCAGLSTDSHLADEFSGLRCNKYRHDVGNLGDYIEELPLASIHDALLSRTTAKSEISIKLASKEFKFQTANVVLSEMSNEEKKSRQLYDELYPQSKLMITAKDVLQATVSVRSMGDCYKICENSEEIDCSGFSYCLNNGKSECFLTYHDITNLTNMIERDVNCTIYSKNHILDYSKIPKKNFESTNIPIEVISPDECAAKCAAESQSCKKFQVCNDDLCYLSEENYHAVTTSSSDLCDIYIPKRIKNFKIAGQSFVGNVIATETALNLEQCAALCYDYHDGGEDCLSFNYCPKGKDQSLCQLAKYKISFDNVTSFDSNICSNYELISDKVKYSNSSQASKAGGSVIFMVLTGFLIAGLLLGVIGQYAYLRYTQGPTATVFAKKEVTWARQIDEEEIDNVELRTRSISQTNDTPVS